MKKLSIFLSATLIVLLLIVSILSYAYLKLTLPNPNIDIEIGAIRETVRIRLDSFGIPHMYADNEQDLFLAQGFMHARDRLFQMALYRRSAQGRLSEIFGDVTREQDIFMRNIRLYDSAKDNVQYLNETTKEYLRSYCDGINEFIDNEASSLPPEFGILRFTPERWIPADCIAVGKLLSLMLSFNMNFEKTHLALSKHHDINDLFNLYPDSLSSSSSFINSNLLKHAAGLLSPEKLKMLLQVSGIPASNNWVLSGSRTESGRPILANDPHLPPQIPSIWYENHLVSPAYTATGVSIPGLPFILIGHNRDVAWGITALMGDNQDLFRITADSTDPDRYVLDGKPRTYRQNSQIISVKGEKDVSVTFRSTVFGPVIEDNTGEIFSLRWSMYDGKDDITPFYLLNTAKNYEDFYRAFKNFSAPTLNIVFADIAGNIGYKAVGYLPVRHNDSSRLPKEGDSEDNNWKSYIPYDKMPGAFNPACGMIVTANNKITGGAYPHAITDNFMPPYRADRITSLLDKLNSSRIGDMIPIQNDVYSAPAEHIVSYIGKMNFSDDSAQKSIRILTDWDRIMDVKGPSLLFQVIYDRLLSNIFADEFNDGYEMLANSILAWYGYPVIEKILSDSSLWFWADNIDTNERETLNSVIEQSLSEAYAAVTGEFGSNTENWNWGKKHQLKYVHPLGRNRFLAPLFNRSIDVPGDNMTVFATGYAPATPYETTRYTVSYRQIIDLSEWDNSFSINCIGQSGHPLSSHYDDQIPLWRNGKYHPMWFSVSNVKENTVSEIRLIPW